MFHESQTVLVINDNQYNSLSLSTIITVIPLFELLLKYIIYLTSCTSIFTYTSIALVHANCVLIANSFKNNF